MKKEQAIKILNDFRNRNYNSPNEKERELANAINEILPDYTKRLREEVRKKANTVLKDCAFYKSYRECTALKIRKCYKCNFYKKRKPNNIDEACELYRIRKKGKKNNEQS